MVRNLAETSAQLLDMIFNKRQKPYPGVHQDDKWVEIIMNASKKKYVIINIS